MITNELKVTNKHIATYLNTNIDLRNHFQLYEEFANNNGTNIPMTIIAPKHIIDNNTNNDKNMNTNTSTNVIVIAYGAYGAHIPMHYSPEHHELLERGFILVFAHIR